MVQRGENERRRSDVKKKTKHEEFKKKKKRKKRQLRRNEGIMLYTSVESTHTNTSPAIGK